MRLRNMKRLILIGLIAAGLLLAGGPHADASLRLRIEDITNPALVKGVVVTDNNAALDSFLDDNDNPVTGILEYSGSVGSFFITVTTVMSKPVIGGIISFAELDLNSVTAYYTGSGTRVLRSVTEDTDY